MGGRCFCCCQVLRSVEAAPSEQVPDDVGVDAAMSGVSRFLENSPPWRYSKAENLEPHDYRQFAYALVAADSTLPGFAPVHVEHGFERVSLSPPFFHTAPKIAVLRRQAEATGASGASTSSRPADDFM